MSIHAKISNPSSSEVWHNIPDTLWGGFHATLGQYLEMARRLDNRATLEHQTAAYFKGLTAKAAAEEADLENALSAASQEMDFDQP